MLRTDQLYRNDRLYTVAASGIDWAIIVEDIKKIAKQRNTLPAGHGATYAPPELKEFGPVGALTQGGSSGGKEMADMLKQDML